MRRESEHPSVAAAVLLLLLLAAAPALAHQPRLVGSKPSVEVRNPEVSQAFYARLEGGPQSYYIRSDKPLRLYLNLLVADQPGIDTDYRAVLYRGDVAPDNVIARLDGPGFAWKPFYEPFGGDHYLLGPELDQDMPAGTYVVVVTSSDNAGKYALAVGKKESFPIGEIIRTIGVLPRLKKEFFGKSPLTGFFNLSGAFLVLVAGGIAGLGALFF
jgi:hypothetical protein